MSNLFENSTECNPDISRWDVSRVTNFSNMFRFANIFNQNISGWDVSSGRDFRGMFQNAKSFNQNISGWDVSDGNHFLNMFTGATSFDLRNFCPGRICIFLPPSPSPTAAPTIPAGSTPFRYLTELKLALTRYCTFPNLWRYYTDGYRTYGPIERWDVSQITDMSNLFEDRKVRNCNPDISRWDVSSVTDFTFMFGYTSIFNQDISGWNVSSGQYFGAMFFAAESFNQDISGWDVSNGDFFNVMFYFTSSFNQNLCSWKQYHNVTSNPQFCIGTNCFPNC